MLAPEPEPTPAGAAAEAAAAASDLPPRLPYGGDAQAATRQENRDAIRAILAARDRAVRRGTEQWRNWCSALADEHEKRKAANEALEAAARTRREALEAAEAEEQAAKDEAARRQREDDRERAQRRMRKEKAEAPWRRELTAQMHNDVHGHFADA